MNAHAPDRYPLLLRLLHWLLAVLLVVQVLLGLAAEHWLSREHGNAVLAVHFKLGLLILCLMTLRLYLRLLLPTPRCSDEAPRWIRWIRLCVHASLYAVTFTLPVSGYVIWIWMGADRSLLAGLELPALVVPTADETGRVIAWYLHVYGAWVLVVLAGLHAAAALHHQWRHRDDFIARRMGLWERRTSRISTENRIR